jgi:hypothetical protein
MGRLPVRWRVSFREWQKGELDTQAILPAWMHMPLCGCIDGEWRLAGLEIGEWALDWRGEAVELIDARGMRWPDIVRDAWNRARSLRSRYIAYLVESEVDAQALVQHVVGARGQYRGQPLRRYDAGEIIGGAVVILHRAPEYERGRYKDGTL